MTASRYEAAIAAPKAVFSQFAERQAEVEAANVKLRELQRELEAAKAERARAIDSEDKDAAIRHVDGDDAAPAKPQRLKRIAALNDKIPGLSAAIPLQKERITDRDRKLADARSPFTKAVLDGVIAIQTPAVDEIQSHLTKLRACLVDLIAADLIRIGTIGDKFPLATGQATPFAGQVIVGKLLSAIPARLHPDSLQLDALTAEARDLARDAIYEIQENSK